MFDYFFKKQGVKLITSSFINPHFLAYFQNTLDASLSKDVAIMLVFPRFLSFTCPKKLPGIFYFFVFMNLVIIKATRRIMLTIILNI